LTSSGDTRKISKDDKTLIESWRKEKPWDAKICCWEMTSQDLIDSAIDQWSKRITMVIQGQGGHIQHRLN